MDEGIVEMQNESNSASEAESESTEWSDSESELDKNTYGQKISTKTFVTLLHYMLQKKDLTGNIREDMDTLFEQFQKIVLIQNLLPKLKFYQEFMKEYCKTLQGLQKENEIDGISKSEKNCEKDAFVDSFDQFEDRFERNLRQFYKEKKIKEMTDSCTSEEETMEEDEAETEKTQRQVQDEQDDATEDDTEDDDTEADDEEENDDEESESDEKEDELDEEKDGETEEKSRRSRKQGPVRQ